MRQRHTKAFIRCDLNSSFFFGTKHWACCSSDVSTAPPLIFFVSLWNRGCKNSSARDVHLTAHVSLTCSVAAAVINQDGSQICVSCIAPYCTNRYLYKNFHQHMRVVLNSFAWKQAYSPKIPLEPHFIFSGTCCPTLVRKTLARAIFKFVPGVCSSVTLRSMAAAFTFCFRMLALVHLHRPILTLPRPNWGHVCFPPYRIHTIVTLQKLVELCEIPCELTCIRTWHVRVRKFFYAGHLPLYLRKSKKKMRRSGKKQKLPLDS